MVKGRMLQGARAMAEMCALCRPKVISAYPITPQTLIVEELSQIVADGDLEAEFINVEGEHSAASVVLGAAAVGVRVFTCSSSQGLLLMSEVIFNAENNQETCDLLLQAHKIAEDHRVMLPAMVCCDGYVLPHAYEIVDLPSQAEVDAFLPPYDPIYKLDIDNPTTMGAYADPEKYMETRYMIQETMKKSLSVIEEVARDFGSSFGRSSYGLFEKYRVDDASTVVVALGSMAGTIKDVVDELRDQGEKVGILRLICYRPFPKEALYEALSAAENIVIMEKDISLGGSGAVATDMRAVFYGREACPRISGFILGLGGRDITVDDIKTTISKAQHQVADADFVGLKEDLELEGING